MTLWDSDFERDHDDVYDLSAARADLDRKRAREGRALTEPERESPRDIGSYAAAPDSDSGSVSAQANSLLECPDCGCPPESHNAVNRLVGTNDVIAHCASCGACWSTRNGPFVEAVRKSFAHPLRDIAVTLAEIQWPGSTASIARTPLGDRLRGREAQ